jgi:hypothetical protein
MRLDYSPLPDEMEAVTKTWLDALHASGLTDDDCAAVRVAFVELARTRTSWPRPAELIAKIPRREPFHRQKLEHQLTEEERARNKARFDAMRKALSEGLTAPTVDDWRDALGIDNDDDTGNSP